MSEKVKYWNGSPALGFGDVYIYPQHSDVESRFGPEVSLRTKLARNGDGFLMLNIPYISAGMDTVTGARMAITMAENGGLGEIHRNNTPKAQSEEVRRVKNRMQAIEMPPQLMPPEVTIKTVAQVMEDNQRGYVVVTSDYPFTGEYLGFATKRDLLAGNPDEPISNVMRPRSEVITVPKGTTLEEAVAVMRNRRIEKIPMVDEEGRILGVYTVRDYDYKVGHPFAALDRNGRLMVGAAIGVRTPDIERACMLQDEGVDALFIDVAHGDHDNVGTMIRRLRNEGIAVPIIAGNYGTEKAVITAIQYGADAVKPGIGPGSVCLTRDKAGTGVPQITAIMEAREAVRKSGLDIPVIADGGIRDTGDPGKAIIAGAASVMMGGIFAGTSDSPGVEVFIDGKLQKEVRGMASEQVARARKDLGDSTTDLETYTPEGRRTYTPFKGPTLPVINSYIGGIRQSMGYAGARTIEEMQDKQLIFVSSAGSSEHSKSLS